jgi:hypothetical protein
VSAALFSRAPGVHGVLAFLFQCSDLSGWKIIVRILRNHWAAYFVGEVPHDSFLFLFSFCVFLFACRCITVTALRMEGYGIFSYGLDGTERELC